MNLPIFHAENLAGNPTCIRADEIAAVVDRQKEGKVIIWTRSGIEHCFSSNVIKDYFNLIFHYDFSDCENPDLSGVVFSIVEHELKTSQRKSEFDELASSTAYMT